MINSENINSNNKKNTNSILGNLNYMNDSLIRNNKDKTKLIKNNKNKGNYNEIYRGSIIKKTENEEIKVTIDKVLFHTKIIMLNVLKILIIIFIIFTMIFLIFYIYKLAISILFINNFQNIINDFKVLTTQYNDVILYWNTIKTIFILPNATIYVNLNETEEHFINLNSKVNNLSNLRIKRYKRISEIYDILLSSSLGQNISTFNFCLDNQRCKDIKNSRNYLLVNGLDSTVIIYGKEIYNYYKDFLLVKNNIKTSKDIINNFLGERYSVLSSNINHVFIFLEQLFFGFFFNDEKDIVNDFYLIIKIMNIVEICYCALLNLFSVLFVYNYITRIIYSVEVASTRINNSIIRLKNMKLERIN